MNDLVLYFNSLTLIIPGFSNRRTMTMMNARYHTKKFQGTCKMGCPSLIQVRGIKVFNEYKIGQSSCPTANSLKMAKKKVLDQLKEDSTACKHCSKNDMTDDDNFLFVHQDVWQQRLLARYGSDLVLLDATYKTTKYALRLFFLCVHTNVGYKVVVEFICEYKDAESIAEALGIIRCWNLSWNPSFFMVDYSLAEINAIEKEFPNVSAFICDFHLKQSSVERPILGHHTFSSVHYCTFFGHSHIN